MGKVNRSVTVKRLMLAELNHLHEPLDAMKRLSMCLSIDVIEGDDIRTSISALLFRCAALEIKLRQDDATFVPHPLDLLPVVGRT
jgi:hypothetical protein